MNTNIPKAIDPSKPRIKIRFKFPISIKQISDDTIECELLRFDHDVFTQHIVDYAIDHIDKTEAEKILEDASNKIFRDLILRQVK